MVVTPRQVIVRVKSDEVATVVGRVDTGFELVFASWDAALSYFDTTIRYVRDAKAHDLQEEQV